MLFMKSWYMAVITLCLLIYRTMFIMPIMLPAIGDAFLHFRNGYPNSKLFHRLADAPLIINDKGRCYENEVASSVATYIDQMSKKKSNEARAKKKWGKKAAKKVSKGRTYTFLPSWKYNEACDI